MYIIAGVDAGINVGYAILDLNGKLVDTGCEKEANDEKVVQIISRVGIPSIIASDVSPPAHFVSKVAARFNLRLFHPRKNLSLEEKRHIAKEIMDPHIRDAYAATVKAYRKYANRLRQIEKMQTGFDKDNLKHQLIQGKAIGKLVKKKERFQINFCARPG